jgi:hypothetical protein
MAVGPDWERLGDLLRARRIQLSRLVEPEWRFRVRFVRAHRHLLTERIAASLESGERDTYDSTTFARAEVAYRWAEGSIPAVLRGEEPTPLPAEPEDVVIAERGASGERLEILMAAAAGALAEMSPRERAAAEQDLVRLVTDRLRELGIDVPE